VNLCLGEVVENAEVVDAEAILWLSKSSQALDSGFAFLAWLMSEVRFDGRADARTVCSSEPLQIVDGFECENDRIGHSGQNMARTVCLSRARISAQSSATAEAGALAARAKAVEQPA
jgi:hypothetical protein